jgi:hypothetical protein
MKTKPKRAIHPDDTLTPEEAALVRKGERQIREGKFVTLAQLGERLRAEAPARKK